MGIKYKFHKFNTVAGATNKSATTCFYTTLIFWGSEYTSPHLFFKSHLLGTRNKFCIINADHHIEMVKRTSKFLCEVTKKPKSSLLFINDPINRKFDGLVKSFSIRSGNKYVLGKWPCGTLTKKKKLYNGVFFFNPNRSLFPIKEAYKAGLPTFSLNNFDFNALKTMYPIFCNNVEGDSIYFHIIVLGNSIIEGKLYGFIKHYKQNIY